MVWEFLLQAGKLPADEKDDGKGEFTMAGKQGGILDTWLRGPSKQAKVTSIMIKLSELVDVGMQKDFL